jgi:hypothetical protein
LIDRAPTRDKHAILSSFPLVVHENGCTVGSQRGAIAAAQERPMNQHSQDQLNSDAEPAQGQRGGIGYVLLWILGVPLPVLILIALVRGCA